MDPSSRPFVLLARVSMLVPMLVAPGLAAAAAADAGQQQTFQPALDRAAGARFDLGGPVGRQARAVQANWLATAPAANPAMLGM